MDGRLQDAFGLALYRTLLEGETNHQSLAVTLGLKLDELNDNSVYKRPFRLPKRVGLGVPLFALKQTPAQYISKPTGAICQDIHKKCVTLHVLVFVGDDPVDLLFVVKRSKEAAQLQGAKSVLNELNRRDARNPKERRKYPARLLISSMS